MATVLPRADDRSIWAAAALAFRAALGPPFSIFVLAPATVALAVLGRDRGLRAAWAVLATAYLVAVALGLVPLETSDAFGGYRVFGAAAHVAAGLGWIAVAGRVGAG